jgi:orotidine-5'-phosphate decarboxylase
MPNKMRKIIPALDTTDLETIQNLIKKIDRYDILYGYKIGFSLGLTFGLPKVAETIQKISSKPIIYDHQKAATDIPDTGKLFSKTIKNSGVNEVILFPQAGPATLEAWVRAMGDDELKVIVGGIMTHPKFVASEGGFIRDEAVVEIYRSAYQLGVRRFVVPLTKPDYTEKVYRQAGLTEDAIFMSPGFGKQGGDPEKFHFLKNHYMIIGRSLLRAEDPQAYLEKVEQEMDAPG